MSDRHQKTKGGGVFRVATYNLENYLDATAKKGCVKSAESKSKIRESIRAINPDVIALQEIGSADTLQELRASLAAECLEFPHWEYLSGADEDLHVAILSRFPFEARRPHTEDSYKHDGQAFRVRRGFAEVDVRVNPQFSFTLFAAHLKSKNENSGAGADALRLEEAKLLRGKIEARLKETPDARIIICGDFNDTEDSEVFRAVAGTGKHRIIDTRPVDKSGAVAWTNWYEEKDRYERIDYVLMTPAMAECWLPEQSGVGETPDWRLASDHRPVVAAFLFSGTRNHMPAKKKSIQQADGHPIMLLVEDKQGITTVEEGLVMAGSPSRLEAEWVLSNQKDEEWIYDRSDGVIYCRTTEAVSRVEQALCSKGISARRVDCKQTILVVCRKEMLCRLASHKELKQSKLTQGLLSALAAHWFPERTARQIVKTSLRDLAAANSVTQRDGALLLNSQKHADLWKANETQREQQILLDNIRARLPQLRAVLENASSHWGYEDPIYRFYHQSFKVDGIWESTGDIVNALKELSERPFNRWFQQIIDEGSPHTRASTLDIGAGLSINDDWLAKTRPKLEAFFHARFMLEMAVRYGSQLKELPEMLPSGWAALLYLYDLR